MKIFQIFLIFAIAGCNWWLRGCLAADSLRERVNHVHEKLIAKAMDVRRDPCLEFYQYSCASWWSKQPQDQFDYICVEEKLKYDANREFQAYFSNEKVLKNKPKFVSQAYDFYMSCQTQPELDPMQYVKWLQEHENIKWALLDPQKPVYDDGEINYDELVALVAHDNANDDDDDVADNAEQYDWVHVLAVARKHGMSDFFIEASVIDNNGHQMIHFSRNPQPNGLWDHSIQHEYIKKLQKTLEIPQNKTDINNFFNAITHFWSSLTYLEVEGKKSVTEVVKLKDLPFEWLKTYVNWISNNHTLDEEMEVSLSSRAYFEVLDKLIKNHSSVIVSRFIELRFLIYLYQQRDLSCIQMTRNLLPMAMAWIFEDIHPITPHDHEEIQQMFNETLKYLNHSLHKTDEDLGISDASIRQLSNLTLKIGYLPQQDTVNILETFYSHIQLDRHHYYSNHLKLLKLKFDLSQNPNPDHQLHDVSELAGSVKYLPSTNVLLLSSYYLVPPIYHRHFDDIYKYSSLANILASGILSTLEIPKINTMERYMFSLVGSLKAAYHALFRTHHTSFSSPSDHTIIETKLQNLTQQQLFFVNAMYRNCRLSPDTAVPDNELAKYMPEFVAAFDCKFYGFAQIFQ